MSVEPDQSINASLVNGLPVVTFPPRPYHRRVTNIVVGNSIASSVTVFRTTLTGIPAAQNRNGSNNTLSGVINLPAGQALLVQWSAVGAKVSDAFARASFEKSDSPLGVDDTPDSQSWSDNPVTSLVLPTNATSGARIVLDGTTNLIQIFNASNKLVAQIDPGGMTVGNDLANLISSIVVRMSVTDSHSASPAFEIQPGASADGNWLPSILSPSLVGLPGAQEQLLKLLAPSWSPDNYVSAAQILLGSGARDNSHNGVVEINGDIFSVTDVLGARLWLDIDGSSGISAAQMNVDRYSFNASSTADKMVVFDNANMSSIPIHWNSDGQGTEEVWHNFVPINGWSAPLAFKYKKVASPPNCLWVVGQMNAGTVIDDTPVVSNMIYAPASEWTLPVGKNPSALGSTTPLLIFKTSGSVHCFGMTAGCSFYCDLLVPLD